MRTNQEVRREKRKNEERTVGQRGKEPDRYCQRLVVVEKRFKSTLVKSTRSGMTFNAATTGTHH